MVRRISNNKAFQSSLVYDGRELQPVYVLLIVVCPVVLFLLAIVLSVLLWVKGGRGIGLYVKVLIAIWKSGYI
jgi:hypothetical protein